MQIKMQLIMDCMHIRVGLKAYVEHVKPCDVKYMLKNKSARWEEGALFE